MSNDREFKAFSGTGRRLRDGAVMPPQPQPLRLPPGPFRAFSGTGHRLGGGSTTQEQRDHQALEDFLNDDTPVHIAPPQNRPFQAFGGQGRVLGTGAVVPGVQPVVQGYGSTSNTAPPPQVRRTGVHTLSDIDTSSDSKRIKKVGNVHTFSD